MSTLTGELEHDAPPLPSRTRSRSERRWDRVRLALTVGWILLIVAVPVFGEREGSWGEVRALVAAGEVDSVRVSSELPDSSTGYSVVEVHYRHGLWRRVAEVGQVRGSDQSDGEVRAEISSVDRILHGSPTRRLQALNPGLRVTHIGELTGSSVLAGWRTPLLLGDLGVLFFIATLVMLINGPAPWRGSRWAWFWVLLIPGGGAAVTALSGPTPGVPHPRDSGRRLTGLLGFLTFAAVTAFVNQRTG